MIYIQLLFFYNNLNLFFLVKKKIRIKKKKNPKEKVGKIVVILV